MNWRDNRDGASECRKNGQLVGSVFRRAFMRDGEKIEGWTARTYGPYRVVGDGHFETAAEARRAVEAELSPLF